MQGSPGFVAPAGRGSGRDVGVVPSGGGEAHVKQPHRESQPQPRGDVDALLDNHVFQSALSSDTGSIAAAKMTSGDKKDGGPVAGSAHGGSVRFPRRDVAL